MMRLILSNSKSWRGLGACSMGAGFGFKDLSQVLLSTTWLPWGSAEDAWGRDRCLLETDSLDTFLRENKSPEAELCVCQRLDRCKGVEVGKGLGSDAGGMQGQPLGF